MKANEDILNERMSMYNQKQGARLGDFLLLPHGEYVRFTYDWGERLQTGLGSFYIGNGYLSYSGGLDSGVLKTDILPTTEKKSGSVWFFDGDISGACRGVYFNADFRVFELAKNADTSGLPQIRAHEKKMYLQTVDDLTMINGNGIEYVIKLPEIIILADLQSLFLDHLFTKTGLKFSEFGNGFICQPQKSEQIVKLLLSYNFKTKYYNNACNHNQLFLEFNS